MSTTLPGLDERSPVGALDAPSDSASRPAWGWQPSRRRRPWILSAAVPALVLAAFLPAAFQLGRATAQPVAPAVGAWLDAEYDFLGALRTWPASPGSAATDPFREVSEVRLVAAGRTVCTRAQDPGMNADGMLDLLGMNPHQTYVIVTESLDKLCPSQSSHLTALTTGG